MTITRAGTRTHSGSPMIHFTKVEGSTYRRHYDVWLNDTYLGQVRVWKHGWPWERATADEPHIWRGNHKRRHVAATLLMSSEETKHATR